MVHKALSYELDQLDGVQGGGPLRVFSDVASGRLEECPFPEYVISRLRAYVHEVTEQSRVRLEEGQVLQAQPIDLLLLGSFLKAVGDPDWRVMSLYAAGVPLGLGVDLPRPPGYSLQRGSGR